MDKLTGVGFCAIAAYLYESAYSTAVAYSEKITSWGTPEGKDIYAHRLDIAKEQTGANTLIAIAVVSLVIGIAFIIRGFIVDRTKLEKSEKE